ncbi:hypothetical protein ACFORO_12555 [Amycolatopsis halotolerans]|uniref:Uncharacterized protein n=1 Tax=Amycolatopsis halotolerans TaxID=330083 RepID=A0ABV7QGK0_9PSEU
MSPVPGYLNRFIDIDLSEFGEGCFVRMLNPKVVPQSMIEPTHRLEVDANGKPVDQDAAKIANDEILCRVIKDWKVYDATDFDSEEPPPLTLPVTPEQLAKVPLGIMMQIQKTFSDNMPSPK